MKIKTTPPSALVVRCADNRFQPAMAEFIHTKLRLSEGDYIPLTIPGSIQGLALQMVSPKSFKILKEQIELLLENNKAIPRIVLINHEGCRAYSELAERFAHLFAGKVADKQKEDLELAAHVIGEIADHFGHDVWIELFMARVKDDGEIFFEPVNKAANDLSLDLQASGNTGKK